jgi:hypothetical protein
MRSKTNPESSGFGLKWWAVYASGRAVEVIGMRPSVAQRLKALRGKHEELLHQEALVDALLEYIDEKAPVQPSGWITKRA